MYTFAYTNLFLTLATPGYRPPASPTDTAIGFDSAPASGATAVQLGFRAPVAISEYIGSVFDNPHFKERLTATAKTFNVPVTINGNLTVTGTCTGCGGGGGDDPPSGTVNSGNASQIAIYGSNGAAVSGDSVLTDSGTTLSYSGSGGITASSGTFSGGVSGTTGTFSGNLNVGGQLIVTGPWLVNSPIPTSGMGVAASGTSSLGISNDGNFYISSNAGSPSQVQTAATVATTLAGYVSEYDFAERALAERKRDTNGERHFDRNSGTCTITSAGERGYSEQCGEYYRVGGEFECGVGVTKRDDRNDTSGTR